MSQHPAPGTDTSRRVLAGVSPPWARPRPPFLGFDGQKGCRDHRIPWTARRKSTPDQRVPPKTTEVLTLLCHLCKVHGRAQDGGPRPPTMPRLHPRCWAGSPVPLPGGPREPSPVPLPRYTERCQPPLGTSHRPPSPVPSPARSPSPAAGTGTGAAGVLQTVPLNNARI